MPFTIAHRTKGRERESMMQSTAKPPAAVTTEEIHDGLAVLVEPGTTFELRVLDTRSSGPVVSGYFNNLDAAVKAAAAWIGKARGVYFTINPVAEALLSRSVNYMKDWARTTTADTNIERRRFVYIDVDAVRPAGVAATDAEHAAALQSAQAIRLFLVDQGVAVLSIISADSGNGGSLFVRVDLPHDAAALALVKRVLEALHSLFSDGATTVDLTVSNASRIARVPGTVNAKGDHTEDRPHRRAHLLDVPANIETCPRDVLERIAALAQAPEPPESPQSGGQPYRGPTFDFQSWLAASGLEVRREKAWGQATLYELEACPWIPDHHRTARIVRFDSGALSAGCFHTSCYGKTWKDLRAMVDGPDKRAHRTGYSPGADEWPAPAPFPDVEGPPFPMDALPDDLQEIEQAHAEALQIPEGMAGTLGILSISAAANGRVIIRARPDWREQAGLFATIVLASGERKSPSFRFHIAPMEARERELAENATPAIAEATTAYEILKEQLSAAKRKAAKKEDSENAAHARDLARELAAFKVPVVPRVLADDTTPEALAGLLAQHRVLFLASAEGGILAHTKRVF